ncbi:hypothetical protein NI17_022655 [Thermobifida halotolerans]|uniref:Uncharacterized protein n=2 Tax=Thermobifida halotolerans TaxID=483545 RepID=A0AA97LWY2_9ACTN|nr:hypothetical protein [Thermobifida halotolerans]UOE19483.1 hypothetical protein NI17_022655 [Thermobifida halotolerans]
MSTKALRSAGATPKTARSRRQAARDVRRAVRDLLSTMATGIDRCMYCGDSLGTDIGHSEPIAETPPRTFDWCDHLLAYSRCNSHEKRERFPRADGGTPRLVDPSVEDATCFSACC